MSGSGIIEAEVFRSEQVSRLARTSDPSSPAKGDAWIRTDIQPTTDSVAALRVHGDTGYLEAPLFDPSVTLGEDVYVGKRFVFADGTEGHLLVTDQGGAVGSPRVVTSAGVEYEAHDALEVNAIPDSVVSRDPDNNSGSDVTAKYGVRISVSQDWPEIGGELSGNMDSTATRAYVYRVSDGQLMGDTDISALAGGDTFTINLDIGLTSGETYNFVVDAEGSSYNTGYDDSVSYPYTSSDGNLEIVDGANGTTSTAGFAFCILRVGNVGF